MSPWECQQMQDFLSTYQFSSLKQAKKEISPTRTVSKSVCCLPQKVWFIKPTQATESVVHQAPGPLSPLKLPMHLAPTSRLDPLGSALSSVRTWEPTEAEYICHLLYHQ